MLFFICARQNGACGGACGQLAEVGLFRLGHTSEDDFCLRKGLNSSAAGRKRPIGNRPLVLFSIRIRSRIRQRRDLGSSAGHNSAQ